MAKTLHKYTLHTAPYNARRYGKPWASYTTNPLNPDYKFIDWCGSPGFAGMFEFTAKPGTVVATGQKDYYKNIGGVSAYLLLMPNGEWLDMEFIKERITVFKLMKLKTAERWPVAAKMALEKNFQWYCLGGKSVGVYWQEVDRWSRVLGVKNPLIERVASALIPDYVPRNTRSVVTMEAFGL